MKKAMLHWCINMKKLIFILFAFLVLMLILSNRKIPFNPPTPVVKYNDYKFNLSQGESNWFNKEDGGNSYLAGSSYEVGKKMNYVTVQPGDKIDFSLKGKPKSIKVLLWTAYDNSTVYASYNSIDKGEITAPKAEGEYILEIAGQWDETHNTSDIFKIKVHEFSVKDIKIKASALMNSSDICKKLFEKYLDEFKNSTVNKHSRINKYTIDKVSKASLDTSFEDFVINYSVKPASIIGSDWMGSNGEIKGLWFVNKEAYVIIEKSGDDYAIKSIGTGP